MTPLTISERICFALAGAILGTPNVIYVPTRAIAAKYRRELARCKAPRKIRAMIKIKIVPAAGQGGAVRGRSITLKEP